MIKKSLVAAVLMAFSAANVTAASLTLWISKGTDYSAFKSVIEAYTQKTGVQVTLETPDDPTKSFETAMAEGKGPDVIFWAHDRSGDWADKGWIDSVEPSSELKAQNVQLGWDAFTYKGKTWGYPIGAEAIGMIYNKKLMPTPPASFEEIMAQAASYKAKGQQVIGWDSNSPYFSWPMLAAHGGYIYKRNSNGEYLADDVGVANAGALAGARVFKQLFTQEVFAKGGMSYGDAEKAMLEGKQALWINGPWAWDALKKAGIDFGVAPLPTVAGKPARPFVGVFGAMLVSKSQNRQAAVDFLEHYLLTANGLAALNQAKPIGVPVNKRFFWKLIQDEKLRNMMDGVAFGRPMPSTPLMSRFWGGVGTALKEIADGKTAEEALPKAAETLKGTAPAAAP